MILKINGINTKINMEIDVKFYEKVEDRYEPVLQIQRDRNDMFLEGITKPLTEELIDEVHKTVNDNIGIQISRKAIEIILTLYPKVKIELLEFSVDDTESMSMLANAITNFYLKCDWPCYGDKIDVNAFQNILQKEIELFEQKLNATSV
jgi:hypothetical protein